jgi:Radical SAM superfamily
MKRILEITTTIGCRLGCTYCPQAKLVRRYRSLTKRKGPRVMAWRVFERCLANVPVDVDIHFSGYSEPWLHPDCTRMVLAAHDAGHQIAAFTTAAGLASPDVERMAHVPFKRFAVHVPDSDGLMKSPINEGYLRTLEALRAANIQGIEFFSFGPPHPAATRVIGRVTDTRLVTLRAGNVERLDGGLQAIAQPPRADGEPIVCRRDRIFQNVLLPSGHVALCCMDYGLDHVLGSLLTTPYDSLHRKNAFLRVLRESNRGGARILCGRCEYAVPGVYQWH